MAQEKKFIDLKKGDKIYVRLKDEPEDKLGVTVLTISYVYVEEKHCSNYVPNIDVDWGHVGGTWNDYTVKVGYVIAANWFDDEKNYLIVPICSSDITGKIKNITTPSGKSIMVATSPDYFLKTFKEHIHSRQYDLRQLEALIEEMQGELDNFLKYHGTSTENQG